MKTTVLSILCCFAPAIAPMLRAQDEKPGTPAPHEEKHEDGEAQNRMKKEMARFHEELEQRMKGAMEKAAQLEAEGKGDEAEELRRQVKLKIRDAIDERQRAMQAKMRERHQSEDAARGERTAGDRDDRKERDQNEAERPSAGGRPDGTPPPELKRKLHHVEQAIGHLREAGLPDPAENLERLANRLRQALQNQERPRPEAGPRPGGSRRDDDLGALRREVEELKKTVRQLCEKRDQEHAQDQPDSQEKHH